MLPLDNFIASPGRGRTPSRSADSVVVIETPFPSVDPPRATIQLFGSRVRAGFPSPADDHVAERLDLNDFLIKRPSATFFVRVQGHSMRDAGIRDGDILVVDRSVRARSGGFVVAVVDGGLVIKELEVTASGVRLLSHNPEFAPVEIRDPEDFVIWGTVTGVVRRF